MDRIVICVHQRPAQLLVSNRACSDNLRDTIRLKTRWVILNSPRTCYRGTLHRPALRCTRWRFLRRRGLLARDGCSTPSGDVIATDLDFANYLLEAAHVGVVHGIAFGVENHVRVAYAVSMSTLCDACRRIETACAALTTAVAAV